MPGIDSGNILNRRSVLHTPHNNPVYSEFVGITCAYVFGEKFFVDSGPAPFDHRAHKIAKEAYTECGPDRELPMSDNHYNNHQRAAELHDLAAHAHRAAAEHHGKQDHQTGQERSRLALEHSQAAYLHTKQMLENKAEEKEPSI